MKKGILFDFDYTLGDSTAGIVESSNYALKQLGYEEKPIEQIKKTIGLTLQESFLTLQPEGTKEEAEEYVKYFVEKADEVITVSTHLYDGVLQVLQGLKQDSYKVGVVTTKYQRRIVEIFNKYDALPLLDLIIGGDSVTKKKPDPEGVNLAIREWGFDKSEILYVGDSLVDAKTAEGAGVDFAAVLTGTTEKKDFVKFPYVTIGASVLEINDYIRGLE